VHHSNTPYDWTIFQLDKNFSVREIMTIIRELIFASDLTEAKDLSGKYDYDIIPIGDSTNFHSYYERTNNIIKAIAKEDLLSIDTGIASLLSCLVRREFYFILERNHIAGFVNRSDLNKLISFLPIYITSLHAESAMRMYFRQQQLANLVNYETFLKNQFAEISKVVEKNGLNKSLDFVTLNDKFEKAKKIGFYTDIYDELEFWQELALYYSLNGKLIGQIDWDKIKDYKEIRNRTMHMKDQLSYSNTKEDLEQLLRFLYECNKIINEIFT
jgi:hypothetical protein